MRTLGTALRYVGFALAVLFGLLAGAFVAGETFDEPGGWAAVGWTLLWLVPLLGLSGYALRAPEHASRPLVALTAVVGVLVVLDAALSVVPRDRVGPVDAVAVLALAVPLGCLGLRRARLGGFLLLVAGGLLLVGTAVTDLVHGAAPGAGPGGSSGAVALPVVLLGALFSLAGAFKETAGARPEAHRR